MKTLGFAWGIGGILLLLLFAVVRLGPMALELATVELQQLHWFSLAVSILYMAYAEGYKGFHLGFAPRVVARASYLSANPRPLHILLAPAFCMGYIYATPKRKLLSFGLTGMIICFVLLVRLLPQPWRGIVDAGVVTGLVLGMASIVYFLLQRLCFPEEAVNAVATDVPEQSR
ncbi:MAG: hypothetical protein Q8L20_09725 [Gammaproteobacteria bacterium]|nr:hypothetical protein [Gammaproteobacteria bacterium]